MTNEVATIHQERFDPYLGHYITGLAREGFHLEVAAAPEHFAETLGIEWRHQNLGSEAESTTLQDRIVELTAPIMKGRGQMMHLAIDAAIRPHLPLPEAETPFVFAALNVSNNTLRHCVLDETHTVDPMMEHLPVGMKIIGQAIIPERLKEAWELGELGTGAPLTAYGCLSDMQRERAYLADLLLLPPPKPRSPLLTLVG
jgi:hypothetical protein